jgi:glycosyltransferase involved in cell wall biosynthesis
MKFDKNYISIVIASFNAGDSIEKTLKSIIAQDYINLEIIIIDGGSNDNTVDIIKKYENYIFYWISEKDNGIYDAWNKGICKAKGDWIMFLGCDDILIPGSILKYVNFINGLNDIESIDIVSSKVKMIDKNGKAVRIKGWAFQWPKFLYEMTIAHPGALHSAKLFKKYGMFDINYKIVGDYEFLLRPGKKLKAYFFDEVTVLMGEGGASDSTKAIKEQFKAVISSGHISYIKASLNTIIVHFKFRLKKIARAIGINIYLRRA